MSQGVGKLLGMHAIVANLSTVIAAEEHAAELPVPPLVIGIGAFVALCALLGVVLAIGKGREHA